MQKRAPCAAITPAEKSGHLSKGKIWLSRRALLEDPWASDAAKYALGTKHVGKVVRIQPFGVHIWADSTLVYEGELRRGIPVTLDITPRPGAKFVVIETEIDRTFHPKDFNPMSRDTRELGLSVRDWVWE